MDSDAGIELSREFFAPRRRKRPREVVDSDATNAPLDNPSSGTSQQAADADPFHLHVLAVGTGSSEDISFGVKGIRIGRDQSLCDVVVAAACVSRLHCILSVLGNEVCVHDKSFNGTFINGRRIGRGRTCMLSNGDLLSFRNATLADAAELTYRFEGPAQLPSSSVAGLEQYTVGPSIGRGSFAVVRLGINKNTNEEVAIKMLDKRTLFADIASASLHSEAEMLRGMVHPNIVRVHDAFESSETVVLVMELVRGGDLFDYIVGRGASPFTEDEARFLFTQLLEAVLYIHSRGVVHCDLKPENVLVQVSHAPSAPGDDPAASSTSGPADATSPTEERDRTLLSASDSHQEDAKHVSPYQVRLLVTDFGVAKYEGEPDKTDEVNGVTAVGTPAYAAPELVAFTASGSEDGSLGTAQTPPPPPLFRYTSCIDVWSLGVLLYVLCSGALPRQAQKVEPVLFNKYMTNLSAECRDLIQAMMRLDPHQRITLEAICHHPWLDGITIEGLKLCEDEDVLSNTTAALSPRMGRSCRASGKGAYEEDASTWH